MPVPPVIAVLLPCHNEEQAIGQVVRAFQTALPQARIFVYDNNSTDQTAQMAREAGAEVRHEPRQGKGHVVRRMFADIEADIYVMADGDGTYEAMSAPDMIVRLLAGQLDMVVGSRRDTGAGEEYRPGHRFGNRLLSKAVALLFGHGFSDMLSGYRVFSRRFVKTFPAHSQGFEIETELTVHALHLNLPCQEHATRYFARAQGSTSKLNTYQDGLRIMLMILLLAKEARPFAFFGLIALALTLTAILLAIPIFITFFETGLVPRIPTAVLCLGMVIMASISLTSGIILHSISRTRTEMHRHHYLNQPPVSFDPASFQPQGSASPCPPLP
ncbi:MAG: glycosyltransferase [Magnetococcales bacterium]|nr:glycosyltransferase [Magnetococcales bacterium]